ncbi:hypothetical protein QFC24_006660 [Naganishia onofrii]|uniref:Uncharacterized protein n=1 Tax=Naganishia onofrii TaxID=1851511 RepID=A0ACC2WY91_9TREE|nr:hypothetical protein QFC24_006660 [Naganishia onofrii]
MEKGTAVSTPSLVIKQAQSCHLRNMFTVLHNEGKDAAPASTHSSVASSNTARADLGSKTATGKRLPKYLTQPEGKKPRRRPRPTLTDPHLKGSLPDGNPPGPSNRSQASDVEPAPSGKQTIRRVAKACVYCKRSHMTCDDRQSNKIQGDADAEHLSSIPFFVSERPCQRCMSRKIGHLCCDDDSTQRGRPKSITDAARTNSASSAAIYISRATEMNPSLSYMTSDPPLGQLTIDKFLNPTNVLVPYSTNGPSSILEATEKPSISENWKSASDGYFDNLLFVTDECMSADCPPGNTGPLPVPSHRVTPTALPYPSSGTSNVTDSIMQTGQEHFSEGKDRESVGTGSAFSPISKERVNQAGPSLGMDNTPRQENTRDTSSLLGRLPVHLPASSWAESSIERVDDIIRVLRPYFLSILHQRSDIEIVQQERWLQEIVSRYEKDAFELSPAAILLWRRTGDIVGSNEKMAKLIGIAKSRLGRKSRLCVYELLDEASGVRMFQDYGQICNQYMPPAVPKEGFSPTAHSTYTLDLATCAQSHGIPDRSANMVIKCATSTMIYMDTYGVPVIVVSAQTLGIPFKTF